MKMRKHMRISALLLAVCLLAGVFAACSKTTSGIDKSLSLGSKSVTIAPEELAAATYNDVYSAIKNASYANSRNDMVGGSVGVDMAEAGIGRTGEVASAAPNTASGVSAPQAAPSGTDGSKSDGDYSDTNVQVEGVDEGDIIKTDGEYIYVLKGNELIIVKAEGANTFVVSRTKIVAEEFKSENNGSSEWAQELYISGDKLVVIKTINKWEQIKTNEYYTYNSSDRTVAAVYDVSNKTRPSLIGEAGQDGYYTSSRMIDGTLYLVTNYYVYDPQENDPGTFVPCVYRGETGSMIAIDDIRIMPYISSTSYVVVSAIDTSNAETTSVQSVLGGGYITYMNHENLYVCNGKYDTIESEPYTADQYTVVDYNNVSATEILRFDLSGGAVTFAAAGTVNGSMLNQFSLDEKDGYLRVVTTLSSNSYSIYTDEKYGWSQYQWRDDTLSSALYVLDEGLNLVGGIENLSEDERVYSVRFDGDIGYFVTYRQVDPLFAVDLSDPTSPKLLSALKIPGFSEYLHVYSEGRLFGLGMSTDAETNRTEGMKLSMFDVSDPADVTEISSLKLEGTYWSVALYNHKAILISAEKDLIAFPTESSYLVYGYSDQTGFYLKGEFDTGLYMYDARGMYIGDYIYICSTEGIEVHTLDGFEKLANLTF